MQSDNRFLDDAARIAGGALGTLAGLRREVEQTVRAQLERVLARMNLVSREEFDAVKEMAAKARAEQEDLAGRVAALERAAGQRGPAASDPPCSAPKSDA